MESQKLALQQLDAYQPADIKEQEAKAFIRDFVVKHEHYWSRSTLDGHLTASAWITNKTMDKAVLLHHGKLDMWVQPGGHIDETDASLSAAGLREASEETGLKGLELKSQGIFDLDVHRIPARKEEPEHWHLDVRFWFIASDTNLVISEESNELAWLDKESIEKLTQEESVLRMVRKTLG